MKSWFESVRFILTLNMNLVKMVKSSQGVDSIHLNGLYFGYGALSAVMMKCWFESVRFILTLNMNLVKMVKSSQGADSIHLNGLYFGYGALSAVMMTTPPHSMDY